MRSPAFVVRGDRLPVIYISGDNAVLDVVADIAARIGAANSALLFAGAARTPCSTVHR